MAEGKRPGGLTALAVLNFVFGGLGALGTLGLLALVAAAKAGADAIEGSGGSIHYEGPSVTMIYVSVLLGAVGSILLIMSGVGYIKQKRFLGRTLGTAYALLSIGNTAIGLAALHTGFGLFSIIGLIYPVLTLILVNTTFKDDLTN